MVRFPIEAPAEAPFAAIPTAPFPAVSFDGRQIAFQTEVFFRMARNSARTIWCCTLRGGGMW
jgi:hypothetical protein